MAKLLFSLIPTNSLAKLIAELVTKALANIKDKDKLAKISAAVASCGTAVNVCAEAVKDGEITEEEVNQVSDSVEAAVKAIIEAAK